MPNMRIERRMTSVIALCAVLLLNPAMSLAQHNDVAVSVGGNDVVDACPSWAVVAGLNPSGDGFLAVRAGPGTHYRQRDKLTEGRGFYVCSNSRDGQWVGIVYPRPGQDNGECGVHGVIVTARAYTGPCHFGWVHQRWVNVIAG
jgi:hypothetical protein